MSEEDDVVEGDGEEQTIGARTGTPDVFISYASHDILVADNVAAALEAQGLKCWIAPRDVTPGAHYASEIVHAIDSAKVIVLILSQEAATSPHVLREIERATSKRHPVVTLRVDLAPLPAEFEYFLNTSQWLDASDGDATRMIPKLATAVGLALERSAGPAPAISATPAAGTPAFASGARSGVARFRNRTAIVAGFVVALAIAGFAAYRSWLPGHRVIAPAAAVADATPAVATATPAIPEKSVAVLPFVDMSEKKDQEYFSDGMSEELIDMLTKIPDLRVPARTSSFYFKGRPITISDIAKALGVTYVLEGSVRKSGNVLRVTAQLIRVDTGYHLWSQTYDRKDKDIFAVQDDIARSVVTALKVTLGAALQIKGSRGTDNDEAYDQFLLGRQLERGGLEDNRLAVEAYQKAIALDPNYAAAYAGRAVAEGYAADIGDQGGLERAANDVEKAIELAPNDPSGYLARSFIRQNWLWDWFGAQADIEKVLTLDPRNSDVYFQYALLLESLGRLPEATVAQKKATELDALSSQAWRYLARLYTEIGDYASADAALGRAIELEPTSEFALTILGRLRLAQGRAQEALDVFRNIDNGVFRRTGVAMVEHTLGHAKGSQQALDDVIAKYDRAAYQIAEVYAWRGEKDKAFEWLERAYQQQDGGLSRVKGDALLKSLRNDPRFNALLRKMNLPE
jgi:adenylate cyclase